ncbi:hypothetical protein ABZ491_27315, partial [Micromonospora rifamycinica]|uniref:hypothetical protein n=1 Tax=Micromonospora rifamycinica TaxID=291594 RepID=UPI0034316848
MTVTLSCLPGYGDAAHRELRPHQRATPPDPGGPACRQAPAPPVHVRPLCRRTQGTAAHPPAGARPLTPTRRTGATAHAHPPALVVSLASNYLPP